jgi:hypothetical protein
MAERRVMTNPDLLKIILDFLGMEIKRACDICRKPLKYQIFTHEIQFPYKKYINMETCEIKYFCSEECLNIYKIVFSNKRFCFLMLIISLIFFILIILI